MMVYGYRESWGQFVSPDTPAPESSKEEIFAEAECYRIKYRIAGGQVIKSCTIECTIEEYLAAV